MRPFCVVVLSPLFDDDFGLLEAIEDFSIEQFVPEFSVKALVVAVFPGAAGFSKLLDSIFVTCKLLIELIQF